MRDGEWVDGMLTCCVGLSSKAGSLRLKDINREHVVLIWDTSWGFFGNLVEGLELFMGFLSWSFCLAFRCVNIFGPFLLRTVTVGQCVSCLC